MAAGFSVIWDRIQKLPPGMTVPNWTRDARHNGCGFVLAEAGPEGFSVAGPNINRGRTPRTVSRLDCEKVHRLWEGYRYGKQSRTALGNVSWNTRYIISLFKFVDG